MHRARGLLGWVWRAAVAWAAAGALGGAVAQAQPAPPALVGQLAVTEGTVWLYDREPGDWRSSRHEPLVNWPLTSGDRLRTDGGARAVLRVAAVTVRLDGDTELELARLESGQLVFRLWRGRAAWHVLDDTQAGWITLLADPAKVLPQRAGHYRLDQGVGELRITTWRGEARVLPEDGEFTVKAGRQATLVVDGPGGHWRMRQQASVADDFADWALRDARDDAAPRTARQLGDTLSGWQALERHGRWREDPDWGWLWVPADLRPGWQPYRDGRWVWVTSWGWTWVDQAPWGFVTVHYGRWIPWRGGWAWQPGPRHERPVFSPVPPALTPPPPPPRRVPPVPVPRVGDHAGDRPPEHRPGGPVVPVVPVVPVLPPSHPLPRPTPGLPPGASSPGHGPAPLPTRPPVTEVPDKPIPRVPGFSRPRPPEAPAPAAPLPATPLPAAPAAPSPAVGPVVPAAPPVAVPPKPDVPRPAVPPPVRPRPEPGAAPDQPRPGGVRPEPRPRQAEPRPPQTPAREPGREPVREPARESVREPARPGAAEARSPATVSPRSETPSAAAWR